jgi:hypothetical protein
MKNDDMSQAIVFENEPTNAPGGERFFHIREPDGYINYRLHSHCLNWILGPSAACSL